MKTYDRKNGFLGVHFDFHASRDNRHIGKSFTEKTVQDVIDMLHPDYIQCDTKGAYGIASYPTRLENRAPEIDKDILKIWRKVTKENGMPQWTTETRRRDIPIGRLCGLTDLLIRAC